MSDDAENFAGEDVTGPLTAYAEAEVIKEHAAEIADGKTYAELEQDDPRPRRCHELVVPPGVAVHVGRWRSALRSW